LRVSVVAATAVSLLFAGGESALAQTAEARPPDQEAQAVAAYQRGIKFYNLGQFEDAIAAFKEAYLTTEAPELLYDIAQSYRLEGQGHCTQALQSYRSYLRVAPTTPKRKSVEAAIADMEQCSRSEAPAVVEKAPAAAAPAPPTHVDTPPPVPEKPRGHTWLGPAVGGVGLAVAAAGGALFVWSRLDYNSLHDSCAPGCSTGAVDSAKERQSLGGVLLVAGGALVITGVVLWLVDRPTLSTTGSIPGVIRF
jgi:tetratricopeptide (TPR) repeat protein